MKYLIFLALVALALAAPPKKPEIHPGGPKPAHLPPTGIINPFDHQNVTGQPPHHNSSRPPHPEDSGDSNEYLFDYHNVTGHDNSSRPHHPEDSEESEEHTFDHHNVTGHSNFSKPPHSEDLHDNDHVGHPKPAGGPLPPGKLPVKPESQAKPGQGPKPRPKRHLKGAENHPTGAPHGDQTPSPHTHESGASRATPPGNHGGGKPGENKGQSKL
ncbi:uncharacterized protein LOC143768391 isoform X1 [Ranitomeya variabilis]|uniref:uncharacterized protein LOC143768391 isoform X1 n=1 Tax=Ranitomeya variabilis TaxID=490064 RepID=UPI004057478F